MKLNRETQCVPQWDFVESQGFELSNKLPSIACKHMASILIIEKDGTYYVAKSRVSLEGVNSTEKQPIDLYDLEFVEYTLSELKAICNPKTYYALPKNYAGSNVLIHM